MRNNQPVSQREYDYSDDATLMSVTDTQSHITYANAAFIKITGYDREEVLGQPHNMVRHPDMPTEAFADMWRTLQGGQSWSALVKNRRKDGDHYWLRLDRRGVGRGQRVFHSTRLPRLECHIIDQAGVSLEPTPCQVAMGATIFAITGKSVWIRCPPLMPLPAKVTH